MKFLASRPWRIFLVAWMLYSLHFATNVVREHYPAFAIVDHGTFRVDEYQGFHSDIFVHRDGHSVIGNQVLVSVLAAPMSAGPDRLAIDTGASAIRVARASGADWVTLDPAVCTVTADGQMLERRTILERAAGVDATAVAGWERRHTALAAKP